MHRATFFSFPPLVGSPYAAQQECDVLNGASTSQAHIAGGGGPSISSPVMMYEERPWGNFTVLDEAKNYKVKRIEVLPEQRLSYQKHAERAEHWMIVAGIAKVTLNGREVTVPTGGVVDVPAGAAHRIENIGAEKLIFIEIQRGSYLGEDDIQRLQDDYGR